MEDLQELIYSSLDEPSKLSFRYSCKSFQLLPTGLKKNLMTDAIRLGYLSLIIWMRDNGCPINNTICHDAALNGHVHIIKWARANGCPWDENVCEVAVQGGHLEILQWARANGCPWDEKCM